MRFNWVAWLMRNYRITFLLIGIFCLLGIFGVQVMPKDEFPGYTIRTAVVAAVYPGATSEEVEEQVVRPLERYLFTFSEVRRDHTTSTSQNGVGLLFVELNEEVSNSDEVWNKIKHGLNTFKATLPSGCLAIVVNDDFGDVSALLIALESDTRSYRELHGYSEALQDRLRRVPSVSNVRCLGDVPEQITLTVDRQRLAAYGIGQTTLMQALSAQGLTTMAGTVSTPMSNVSIHVAPTTTTEDDIANLIIYIGADGETVRVRDVATVSRGYDMSGGYIQNNQHPCILLSLEMSPGNNIVQYGEEVQAVLDDFIAHDLPDDVNIARIVDQPKVVDMCIQDFLVNLIESMLVIILVMLVLFPLRTALIAGLTVPLSTFISIGVMYLLGIPLNIMTLAGLIIVLGMIVDNSIVVLDGYTEYIDRGMSRWHAAAESARHYFAPMAFATLCICAMFYPFLLTMNGILREMIYFIPVTITIGLVVSLLVAVVVIPNMEYALIRPRRSTKKSITDYVQQGYEHVLRWVFGHGWLTIFLGVVLVIASLFIFPLLKIRFLPFSDRNQFVVEVFLPEGSGIDETRAVADSIYRMLDADERVLNITTLVGCSSPRFQISYAPQMAGPNFAQLIVNTPSNETTVDLLHEYDVHSNDFPGAYVRYKRLDFQNFDAFELRFYGEDIDSMQYCADQVMDELRRNPDLEWVRTSYASPIPHADILLDPVASAQLGITRTLAQLQLTLSTGSITLGSVWEDGYALPVVLKDSRQDHLDYSSLGDLSLTSMPHDARLTATPIPLRQVAQVQPRWSPAKIVHRGGERCMTVTAEPRWYLLTDPLQPVYEDYVREHVRLPEGVRFEMGGSVENNAAIMTPVIKGFVIAFVIVFFFILLNFKNYKLTLISLVSMLLAVPGAMLGLWAINRMMGVTAIFGFVTLMAMIMRNEILIFDHAHGLVTKGWSVRDAAYDAGRRRMVPIFLTTATTAVGVIPMILAGSSFWMPVGVTIFAGGIGMLVLVVTVLPVIYWKIYENHHEK